MKKKTTKSAAVHEASQAAPTTYNASDARKNFFAILQTASAGSITNPVIVRHKDLAEDVALVNARELGESQKQLKYLIAGTGRGGKFKLFGSGTLHGDVEEILREIRADANSATARRLEQL